MLMSQLVGVTQGTFPKTDDDPVGLELLPPLFSRRGQGRASRPHGSAASRIQGRARALVLLRVTCGWRRDLEQKVGSPQIRGQAAGPGQVTVGARLTRPVGPLLWQ